MEEKQKKKISKFLSFILRHNPGFINLELDENGWAATNELIEKMSVEGSVITLEEIEEIVDTNDKKRFAFSPDRTKIRASQGHSLSVDLDLEPAVPPEYLYHGTVDKFINQIKQEGLQKMDRQHVHLSGDRETAGKVGGRRGKPVILTILASEMHKAGLPFYISHNGVWLCDAVPVQYIQL